MVFAVVYDFPYFPLLLFVQLALNTEFLSGYAHWDLFYFNQNAYTPHLFI